MSGGRRSEPTGGRRPWRSRRASCAPNQLENTSAPRRAFNCVLTRSKVFSAAELAVAIAFPSVKSRGKSGPKSARPSMPLCISVVPCSALFLDRPPHARAARLPSAPSYRPTPLPTSDPRALRHRRIVASACRYGNAPSAKLRRPAKRQIEISHAVARTPHSVASKGHRPTRPRIAPWQQTSAILAWLSGPSARALRWIRHYRQRARDMQGRC